jgi:hypothetical protein
MFMPFVERAIGSLNRNRFTSDQVKSELQNKYGLQIPDITLSKMLNRFKSRNDVIKEAGSYVIQSKIEFKGLESVREEAGVKLSTLSRELRQFASEKGITYTSEDDAASALFDFLERFHSDVLLRNGSPQSPGNVDRETKVLSRFIYEECQSDNNLYNCLNTVVVGYTLQDALTLSNISTPPKEFEGLEVYFDSGFLFGLLGFEGEAHERAFTETTQLLRRTGARLRCFRTTVDEMERILDVYRRKLHTVKGRSELRPTPLTRYFLGSNSTSGDVEEIIALLDESLTEKGIQIRERPKRNSRYTLDEDDLYVRLSKDSDKNKENDEEQRRQITPRVDHDVDCTAAILTLRHGQRPPDLDSTSAVFASTSKSTVDTICEWHKHQSNGISPVLRVSEVSNRAWLKRPSAATDLKMNELVALCYAALRPSDEAWSKFKSRLEKMVEAGKINSDEKAALVASKFTDRALSEAEEEAELDESTLDEVIFRVKEKYSQEAKERIQQVKDEAESEIADLEQELQEAEEERDRQARDATRQEKKLDSLIGLLASAVANTAYYGAAMFLVIGLYTGLPESLRFDLLNINVPYANKIFSGLALVVLILNFFNLLFGLNLENAKEICRRKVAKWMRDKVEPES